MSSLLGRDRVETPTATAGLVAERSRLEQELVDARKAHGAAEVRARRVNSESMTKYYAACEIERALDAVDEALNVLGVKVDPRAKGAETMPGKYAHNLPKEVTV